MFFQEDRAFTLVVSERMVQPLVGFLLTGGRGIRIILSMRS